MNSDDMFTRLLFNQIETGIAPRSFYKLDKSGGVQTGHFDGVPVYVASTVVSRAPIKSLAEPITRIYDHADGYEAFVQKLNALPPETRGESALAISEAFSRPLPTDRPIAGHENFRVLYQNVSNDADIPHLSEAFIQKCLKDMTLKNLVR